MRVFLVDGGGGGMRVAVAMSGGVDSSTTAAWLVAQGHEVVGLTMHLWDQPPGAGRGRTCCAVEDLHDARQVAERLKIPFYVVNLVELFRERVVGDFLGAYVAGETPNPCVRCNQYLKFEVLLQRALALGAECLATGHYATRRLDGRGRAQLWRGRDPAKDQSYFLFATRRAQLERLLFPLGELTKEETRVLAERFGLHVAAKRDSQDVCFVPDGDYAAFFAAQGAGLARPGAVVDLDGREVGRHRGIVHYTIGQRRGLGIAARQPLYVVRLEVGCNRVVVGPAEALYRQECTLREVNWLGDGELAAGRVGARLRYAAEPQPAWLEPLPGGRARVRFDAPQRAVTPGQACVWYAGERLLGGGWIDREEGSGNQRPGQPVQGEDER